jgi:tetratricopeptide (TPR) repeat protein
MKILNNKDNNYSLNYSENYRSELIESTGVITKKYSELLCEYIKFIIENTNTKNKPFSKFIIIRGMDTITNVFNNILYYTKNIDLTYFHCQKSFYFYLEFVGQISEDEKMFLQLTSRDATTYVYKKTLFEISNELKKINETISNETRSKLDIINIYIQLYQTYLLKIIQIENTKNIEGIIEIFDNLCNKLSNFNEHKHIGTLYSIIEKLYYDISDINIFFELNRILINKFLKNPETIKNYKKKLYLNEFTEKLLEAPDRFIDWFIG